MTSEEPALPSTSLGDSERSRTVSTAKGLSMTFRRVFQQPAKALRRGVNLAPSESSGDPEKAIELYCRGIELAPEKRIAHGLLGFRSGRGSVPGPTARNVKDA